MSRELLGLARRARRAAPRRSGAGGARSPRRPRCASRSGTCRSTTATCSRGRSGGPASSMPSSPPAISIARFEMTSLTFMFVCVPEPVCQTKSGKWSSSLPSMTSSAACDDQRRDLGIGQLAEARGSRARRPSSGSPSARITSSGMRSPRGRRWRSAGASAGSARPSSVGRRRRSAPMLSVSVRNSVIVLNLRRGERRHRPKTGARSPVRPDASRSSHLGDDLGADPDAHAHHAGRPSVVVVPVVLA